MYQWALKTAEGKFHGTTEERDGKLYFNGTVATEAEKNQIWGRDQDDSDVAERCRRRHPRHGRTVGRGRQGGSGETVEQELHGEIGRYPEPYRQRTPGAMRTTT
jgi:hypothetical protein